MALSSERMSALSWAAGAVAAEVQLMAIVAVGAASFCSQVPLSNHYSLVSDKTPPRLILYNLVSFLFFYHLLPEFQEVNKQLP